MWEIVGALCGYLIGCINPSYIIAKCKGFDIRKKGSGNAGGSNALITMGNKIGVLCMVFDILKAYLAVKGVIHFMPDETLMPVVVGVACILGHMFPAYMHFKGGKGLACLGGVVLAYSPAVFVVMISIGVVLAFLTDYICFVPITASVAFPLIYGYFERNVFGVLIYFIATIAILYKHMENLKRIKLGTEAHFSYLWSKDPEIKRMKEAAKSSKEKDAENEEMTDMFGENENE